MIVYSMLNIFDSPANMLVCPVNTVGVMGAGLALDFALKYPKASESYKTLCGDPGLKVGELITMKDKDSRKLICFFPTKKHWKDPSEMEYIELGMCTLANYIINENITSVALPALGCGLGGLKWDNVKYLYDLYLDPLEETVAHIHLTRGLKR